MILRLFRFKNSNMPTREKIKGTRSEPTLARFSCAKEEDKKTGKQESRNFRYWWIQNSPDYTTLLTYTPTYCTTRGEYCMSDFYSTEVGNQKYKSELLNALHGPGRCDPSSSECLKVSLRFSGGNRRDRSSPSLSVWEMYYGRSRMELLGTRVDLAWCVIRWLS